MTQPPYSGPPAPQFTPTEPPKKKHTVRNVILAVVAVGIIAAIAGGGSKSKDPSAAAGSNTTSGSSGAGKVTAAPANGADPKNDVTITGCKADETGYLSAAVKVTNHSSKPSNYIVNVIFENKDGSEQLDTGLVAVNELAPGQSSNQDAGALKTAPKAGFTCKLGEVTRYAS